jgi:uncharacterized integral membrane protein
MADDDRREAFASARDTAKQLITLATSILTVTITFQREIAPLDVPDRGTLLLAAWVAFAASVGFGAAGLIALTAEQAQRRREPTLTFWAVRWPLLLQVLAFLIATGLIVWFGSRVILGGP